MDKKLTKEDIINAAKCCTADNYCGACPLINRSNCITDFMKYILEYMENEPAPTADVQEVKRGTWENTNTPNQLRCSNCEIIHFIAQYPHGEINYCPNCGAKCDI